jgi:hypothetical protein
MQNFQLSLQLLLTVVAVMQLMMRPWKLCLLKMIYRLQLPHTADRVMQKMK